MKLFFISLLITAASLQTSAQYADPNIPKPSSGYGSDGTHTVGHIAFPNPRYLLKDIEIFYPSDISGKVPTIFYSHAFGGNVSANISGMLNFVAMKGYAIVYVPYQTTGVTVADRYDNLLKGFQKAARDYPSIIDTSRVGFMGHSFGGGASFGNGYTCFTQYNWGQNGRFIYALAQWYSYNISQSQLQSFPSDVKLLTEIFDDDVTNDHRMAIDIFNTINISPAEKDFLLVKSDTINGYVYAADHVLPNTSAAFDALDYYAYYRFIDALCDYTFNNSLNGKNVALGNGSSAQITMPGGLKALVQTDAPVAAYPQSKYQYPCNDTANPRQAYCSATVGLEELHAQREFHLSPNPASDQLHLEFPVSSEIQSLRLYNMQGQLCYSAIIQNTNTATIDISSFQKGLYVAAYGNKTVKFLIQ